MYVKCYPGRRNIHFIPSISKTLSQKCKHCVQYTRCHLMSLISYCWHGFCQSGLIWTCYLFLRRSALQAVQTTSRLNSMLKWANIVAYLRPGYGVVDSADLIIVSLYPRFGKSISWIEAIIARPPANTWKQFHIDVLLLLGAVNLENNLGGTGRPWATGTSTICCQYWCWWPADRVSYHEFATRIAILVQPSDCE